MLTTANPFFILVRTKQGGRIRRVLRYVRIFPTQYCSNKIKKNVFWEPVKQIDDLEVFNKENLLKKIFS